MAKVWSIVVAGGSGQRFGRPKQFSLLGDRPVLEWAIDACRPCSAGVVLVVPAGLEHGDTYGADVVVGGGPTRADSVRRGLAAVPAGAEVILVHDAARPLASPRLFAAVLHALDEEAVDGVVPGVPPGDTIKTVDEAGNVTGTLARAGVVAVQTPQAFMAGVLRRAHARVEGSGTAATDDAVLVEELGARVRVVTGDAGNLKITTPEDLATAERLLSARTSEER